MNKRRFQFLSSTDGSDTLRVARSIPRIWFLVGISCICMIYRPLGSCWAHAVTSPILHLLHSSHAHAIQTPRARAAILGRVALGGGGSWNGARSLLVSSVLGVPWSAYPTCCHKSVLLDHNSPRNHHGEDGHNRYDWHAHACRTQQKPRWEAPWEVLSPIRLGDTSDKTRHADTLQGFRPPCLSMGGVASKGSPWPVVLFDMMNT